MRQYIHLISNTTSSLPIDTWRPAGTYIDPGRQIKLLWVGTATSRAVNGN